ncbi:Alpha/Beta hydrolase protein [Mycena sp. CBHHK59/15]|nr:Alpha/Beta hydrolase protein [Mycena sp. CBHHK59/15]
MTLAQLLFSLLLAGTPAIVATRPIKHQNPTVNLGYARYQGFIDPSSNNTNFLGIRYAAAPTGLWLDEGDLRWRNPQTPSRVAGVQFADAEPPCAYKDPLAWRQQIPFHCLFLNVYVPGDFRKNIKPRPVVVWIHGGGYGIGSATGYTGSDIFNGNDLIKESGGDVVAVVLQYRLGLFGFLAGSKVKANGVLNAGLLDQQFAFQWVQKHIGKFGGDPKQVTIWGESAGAGSVLMHMVANNGKTHPPLFRAAITSSLYAPSQYQYNDTVPTTGCSGKTDTLACLRHKSVDILVAANVNISANDFYGTFSMVLWPSLSVREGKLNGLFPRLGPKEIADAAVQYAGLGTPSFQAAAIMGEAIIICPTYALLSNFKGPTYKVQPVRRAPYNNTVFDTAFSESFLNFAVSLNPNRKTWNRNTKVEMLFNNTDGLAGSPVIHPTTPSDALLSRCE